MKRKPKGKYTRFISNTFISNARLKLAEKQTKVKQHPGYHPKIMF